MGKSKIIILFLAWIFLAWAGACGESGDPAGNDGGDSGIEQGNEGGGAEQKNSVTQEEIDALFAALTKAITEGGGTVGQNCITSCPNLAFLINLLAGIAECEGGGSFTLSVGTCNANGTVQMNLYFNHCVDDTGESGHGTITVRFTPSSVSLIVSVTANGFQSGEYTISTANSMLTIPCQDGETGAAYCSGTVTVNDTTCTLNADCSGCTI